MNTNVINFDLLLLEATRRKRSTTIEVSRPVIHLPGPRWPSYCCQSCGHEFITNRCQNCGRAYEHD